LFNVTGGPGLTLFEVNTAAAIIRETAHPDVNLIFGAVIDPDMGDEIRVTVIATGFERSGVPRRALERIGSRTERPLTVSTPRPAPSESPFTRSNESVSVDASPRPSGETKSAASPTSYGSDDLDIPTFLRNRR
jgi:cell division protein FtsZ